MCVFWQLNITCYGKLEKTHGNYFCVKLASPHLAGKVSSNLEGFSNLLRLLHGIPNLRKFWHYKILWSFWKSNQRPPTWTRACNTVLVGVVKSSEIRTEKSMIFISLLYPNVFTFITLCISLTNVMRAPEPRALHRYAKYCTRDLDMRPDGSRFEPARARLSVWGSHLHFIVSWHLKLYYDALRAK